MSSSALVNTTFWLVHLPVSESEQSPGPLGQLATPVRRLPATGSFCRTTVAALVITWPEFLVEQIGIFAAARPREQPIVDRLMVLPRRVR